MLLYELTPALTAYLLFLTVVLGTVMGSFAACTAWRIAVGEDFLRGRSHCDECGHVLTAKELVPVVSWLVQRGKCRWCGAKISVRCPVTELLCAAAFVGIVLRYGITLQTLQYLILTVLLLMVALVDYDTGLIPNGLLLVILIDWAVFTSFLNGGAFLQNVGSGLMSGLAASVPLLLLTLLMDRALRQESMGGGDIKFFFVAGLFFPIQGILFLMLVSSVLGLLFAALTKKTAGDPENPKAFPFGPAIAAGVYLSMLAAETAVEYYINLFL